MKISKKGSHVGMMLSFGIFIIFLVFLYSILQPMIKIEQDKKLVLNDLIGGLVEMLDSDSTTTYSSGSIKTAHNFVAKITELANEYDDDYNELKGRLNVTEGNEFGFIFVDVEGADIAPETNVPESVNVYAKKIPVYYTGEEENVLLGFITLKIW